MKNSISNINAELELKYQSAMAAVQANNFCTVFDAAKPLLVWFSKFFLIPKKWRNIINGLTTVCDNFCNNQNNN